MAGSLPTKHDLSMRPPEVQTLSRQITFLFVERDSGVLCQALPESARQAVLPRAVRLSIIQWAHLHLSHLGAEKVISYLQTIAWFPGMTALVKQEIARCHGCLQKQRPAKPHRIQEAYYVHPKTAPGEEICIDFCGPLHLLNKVLSMCWW